LGPIAAFTWRVCRLSVQSLLLCRIFVRIIAVTRVLVGVSRPAGYASLRSNFFVRQKQQLACITCGVASSSYIPAVVYKSLIVSLCSLRKPLFNTKHWRPHIRDLTLRVRLIGHLLPGQCEYLTLCRALSLFPLCDDHNWSLAVCTLISAFNCVGQLVLDYNGI
jgi:hypothetical protein